MKRNLVMCCVVLMITVFAAVAGAQSQLTISIEEPLGAGWQLADAYLSSDQSIVGKQSLYLPRWAGATYEISEENVYGTVTMWVYDLNLGLPERPAEYLAGPRWGIMNKAGDVFAIHLCWNPSMSGKYYAYSATSENLWRNRWNTDVLRSPGWHKFTFFTDGKTLTVTIDDQYQANLRVETTSTFTDGFTGLYFYGGDAANLSGVYIDDIQVSIL